MSKYAPGPHRGSVTVTPRAAVAAIDLEALLEGALMDAVGGDPPGPALAKRLERVAREILLRRGLGAARVIARSDARETTVHIVMPKGPATVSEVVVRVGSALG